MVNMLKDFNNVMYIKEDLDLALETILRNSKCEPDSELYGYITNIIKENDNMFYCNSPSTDYNGISLMVEYIINKTNINNILSRLDSNKSNYIIYSIRENFNIIMMRGLETSDGTLIAMNETLNNYKIEYRNKKRKDIAKYYNENENE